MATSGKWAKVLKVSIYLKKKDDVSDEQFSDYYAQKHAALAGPVLLKHNCISYTQVGSNTDTISPPSVSIGRGTDQSPFLLLYRVMAAWKLVPLSKRKSQRTLHLHLWS